MKLQDLQNITIKVSQQPNDVQKILGTAFFINLEGYILTCYHVVFDKNKKLISPLFFNSAWVDENSIIYSNKEKDIAIFKIKNFTPEISEKIPINLNFSPSVNSEGYSYGYGDAVKNNGNARQYVYEYRDFVQLPELPDIQVFKAENTSTAKVDLGDSGSLSYSSEYEAIIGINTRKKHRMQTLKKSGFDVFQSEVYTIPFANLQMFLKITISVFLNLNVNRKKMIIMVEIQL